VLGLSVTAGVLVYARTSITLLRYRLSELVELEDTLRGDVEKLELKAAALASPVNLEKKARDLGLHYPKTGQIIHLDDVAARPPQ
jgi:hypothetical protein